MSKERGGLHYGGHHGHESAEMQSLRQLDDKIDHIHRLLHRLVGGQGGGQDTITDQAIEIHGRICMSRGNPVELFEVERHRRHVTVGNADGTFDVTSPMTVKSSNPSQVSVSLVPDEGGVPSRDYWVDTPGAGAYTADVTIAVRGREAHTVPFIIKAAVPGTIMDEPVGEPEPD